MSERARGRSGKVVRVGRGERSTEGDRESRKSLSCALNAPICPAIPETCSRSFADIHRHAFSDGRLTAVLDPKQI